jgi:RNA polymerase sigma-70 factor (ECF subfamily)
MSGVDAAAPVVMAGGLTTSPASRWNRADAPRTALALQGLIARHRPDLLAFVHARVRPPIDPADIVQEIWTSALPAIEAGRIDNEKAYLYGIARNLAAEAMRHHYRHSRWLVAGSDDDAVADEAPSAHRVANAKDQLRTLQAAVGGLPERCREVFELRHVEQLGKAEIADRLGISAKQVEKQLRQALARCRRILLKKNNLQDEGSKSVPSPT